MAASNRKRLPRSPFQIVQMGLHWVGAGYQLKRVRRFMKAATSAFALLGILFVFSGCQTWRQAEQDAREVALITSASAHDQEEELRRKMARKFYKAQLDTIEKSGRSDENALQRDGRERTQSS
jgi:uncharacterized protein YlxW (UPF0749 family)